MRAYAAVVYMRIQTSTTVSVRFVASKTRVAPSNATTIPRLELLSALILSRLIVSIQNALEFEVNIDHISCYTDSKVAFYWILYETKEWKQFVQNRVNEIRTLTPVKVWNHIPGKENPADLPSRGVVLSELHSSNLWKEGLVWLSQPQVQHSPVCLEKPKEECLSEMKLKARETLSTTSSLLVETNHIDVTRYSSFTKLIRVTVWVFRFVNFLKSATKSSSTIITTEEITKSEIIWIRESQNGIAITHKNYEPWRKQFGIYQDGDQLLRCQGRIANAKIPESTKHPVLLNKDHPLTKLIVQQAHIRVCHEGVKSTLTELRSRYWLIKGRQYVRTIVNQCKICRRFDSKPFKPMVQPPLPEFRVQQSHPFTHVGLDFAGPLFIKPNHQASSPKTWICLYTCCVTRAVHLELVPDLTTPTFLRCFQRFTSRRGVPQHLFSDNAKTFIAASKELNNTFSNPDISSYFNSKHVKWSFNLEKAPWRGGIFERLIQSTKRCLKRVLGKAKLTYEELTTVLCEVEATLNCRPLTYVSSEDFDEALTPSHLITGHRIMNLPDFRYQKVNDEDFTLTHEGTTKRLAYLSSLLQHFWNRWSREYLLKLRASHTNVGDTQQTVRPGDVVLVSNENLPRGQWKLGRVVNLLPSGDNVMRGAVIRTTTNSGKPITLNRPLQLLFPLELSNSDSQTELIQEQQPESPTTSSNDNSTNNQTDQSIRRSNNLAVCPKRKAAVVADDRRQLWLPDLV